MWPSVTEEASSDGRWNVQHFNTEPPVWLRAYTDHNIFRPNATLILFIADINILMMPRILMDNSKQINKTVGGSTWIKHCHKKKLDLAWFFWWFGSTWVISSWVIIMCQKRRFAKGLSANVVSNEHRVKCEHVLVYVTLKITDVALWFGCNRSSLSLVLSH